MELEEKSKNRTILSKVAISIAGIYCIMGIVAVVSQSVGIKYYDEGKHELANFFYNKVWQTLSPFIIMMPIIAAIPNVVLNIVGMIKEKRIFPFLLCIFAPVIIWIVVTSLAIAYF